MLIREISKNGLGSRVVGFVDDDAQKIGSTIHGIRVYGPCKEIPNIVEMLHLMQQPRKLLSSKVQ